MGSRWPVGHIYATGCDMQELTLGSYEVHLFSVFSGIKLVWNMSRWYCYMMQKPRFVSLP